MGYPGDPCSVFTCAFRAKRELHCAFLGEKGDNYYSQTWHIMIFFCHYNLFLGKHKEKLAGKARKYKSERVYGILLMPPGHPIIFLKSN